MSNVDEHFTQFMRTIQHDKMYRWIYSEYKTCPIDAEHAYYKFKEKEKSPSLWSRFKSLFEYSSFKTGLTDKYIERYLSLAKDRYDFEVRERKVMSNKIGIGLAG